MNQPQERGQTGSFLGTKKYIQTNEMANTHEQNKKILTLVVKNLKFAFPHSCASHFQHSYNKEFGIQQSHAHVFTSSKGDSVLCRHR